MRTRKSATTAISLILPALVFSLAYGDETIREAVQSVEPSTTPNIIFMMSDDQSWNGLSVPMHPEMENSKHPIVSTRNLERLASQGMRFSAAYSPSCVCSPTRASLMNGRNPAANKWTKAGPILNSSRNIKLVPPRSVRSFDQSYFTIGEALKTAGYATAHFGKWHISGGGPGKHGFDVHDGDIGNEQAYKFSDPNPVDIFGMCDRATEFMKSNKEAGKPFFIQLSWHALHAPENALKATKLKYEGKARNPRMIGRFALAEDLDTGVGRIMQAVDDLKLAENTYLIYTSDNGGTGGRTSDLAGRKGSLWEGGIRVPLIIRGPAVKPNSWCHETVVGYDFYPTFCEMAQVKNIPEEAAAKLDGGSIWELLKNDGKGTIKRRHEHLVFHFPHYQTDDGPHSSIIHGDYKLIRFYESKTSALFNLKQDIGEKRDISEANADTTADLEKRLRDFLVSVEAGMPTVNPNYDPTKPSEQLKGKKSRNTKGEKRRNRRDRRQ